jgi:hypothetical protein
MDKYSHTEKSKYLDNAMAAFEAAVKCPIGANGYANYGHIILYS